MEDFLLVPKDSKKARHAGGSINQYLMDEKQRVLFMTDHVKLAIYTAKAIMK